MSAAGVIEEGRDVALFAPVVNVKVEVLQTAVLTVFAAGHPLRVQSALLLLLARKRLLPFII